MPFVEVARLNFLQDDSVPGLILHFNRSDRLGLLRVEPFTGDLEPLDTPLAEDREEAIADEAHALEEPLEGGGFAARQAFIGMSESALQVIDHIQQGLERVRDLCVGPSFYVACEPLPEFVLLELGLAVGREDLLRPPLGLFGPVVQLLHVAGETALLSGVRSRLLIGPGGGGFRRHICTGCLLFALALSRGPPEGPRTPVDDLDLHVFPFPRNPPGFVQVVRGYDRIVRRHGPFLVLAR